MAFLLKHFGSLVTSNNPGLWEHTAELWLESHMEAFHNVGSLTSTSSLEKASMGLMGLIVLNRAKNLFARAKIAYFLQYLLFFTLYQSVDRNHWLLLSKTYSLRAGF